MTDQTNSRLAQVINEVVAARAEILRQARGYAKAVIADTVGVIQAGAQQPEIERLTAFCAGAADHRPALASHFPETAMGAQALTIGLPRTDPFSAAFINATAGTFLELDEGIRPTGHPAIHVLPAALAVGQAVHASGEDLLWAFLAGYEVTARVFAQYRPTYPRHPHGTIGSIGAAVATATLLERDPLGPAALAACLPITAVWQICFAGATVRNCYSGAGATIGILANLLDGSGFTGDQDALDSIYGAAGEARTTELDPRPAILRNYVKFHSACALTHTAIDAALAVRPYLRGETQEIRLETTEVAARLAHRPESNPLSRRFSLPYTVAAALTHGHANPDAFDAEDPEVNRLCRQIEIVHRDDLDRWWPRAAPVQLTITTSSGTHGVCVRNPRGYVPFGRTSQGDLRRKFNSLTALDRRGWFDRILELETVTDLATLFEPPNRA